MFNFSVVIPTYNRKHYLGECLQSVLAGHYPPLEIIVVDDGSTDDTQEFLESLKIDSLRYFYQARQGPAKARNFGISKAKGNWIALLDSDDLWLPEKLARQVQFLSENREAKVCQCEEIWTKDGVRVNPKKRHQKFSGWIFEKCLPLCIVSPSAVVVLKDFFLEVGGFDPDLEVCEDYDLWLRMALKTPIYTLPETLIQKRGGHVDQLSKQYWGMDRFRVWSLEKLLKAEALSVLQRAQVTAELLKKLKILSLGFSKRFPTQHNEYEEKWKNYQKEKEELEAAV